MSSNEITLPQSPRSSTELLYISLIAGVTYALFGWATEFLAIPPNYATPVWPAAGLALAFVLRFGVAILPGLFVGAVCINFVIAWSQGLSLGVSQFGLTVGIAVGSCIQATLSAMLILKYVKSPTRLQENGDILRFTFIAGPLGCLISSLNGATLLSLFAIAPWNLWPTNWLTWWVGDTVGALVVAPFMLKLLLPVTLENKQRSLRQSLPTIALFFLVLILFFYIRGAEAEQRKERVQLYGHQLVRAIEWQMHDVQLSLEALRALFESSQHVTIDEFNHFSSRIIKMHPALLALEWVPRVEHEQRSHVVASMRKNGFASFEFVEKQSGGALVVAVDRDVYFPIQFVYPYEGNELALGLDVSHLAYRKQKIASAIETGTVNLSEPIHLMQEANNQLAYILIAPVFPSVSNKGEVSTAPNQVQGLVQVLIKFQDLLSKTELVNALDAKISLVDITTPGYGVLVYGLNEPLSDFGWSDSFSLLNRTIEVSINPGEEFLLSVSEWHSYAVLIAGLLYVAMLEVIILSMSGRNEAIEAQVEEQTGALIQAKELAEKASNSKTEFLTKMSHELRTPLNSVIGFTRRVINKSSEVLDARSVQGLELVEKNGKHLLSLINDLLDLSKVEAGKLDLEITQFRFAAVLIEIETQFKTLVNNKGLNLFVEQDYDALIEADERRTLQVLMNLVANALKFTEVGCIRVSAEDASEDGIEGVLVVVSDSGIGIAEEDLPRLFRKFEQVAQGSKDNSILGTGLGLALVKEITELHGGKVKVMSKFGSGSQFHVWLPKKQQVRE